MAPELLLWPFITAYCAFEVIDPAAEPALVTVVVSASIPDAAVIAIEFSARLAVPVARTVLPLTETAPVDVPVMATPILPRLSASISAVRAPPDRN